MAVLLALWLMQHNNVNSLAQQINALQQQINALPATVAPKDKLALEKNRVNAQNSIYGTLIQALGSAFFVVTAYFTYRNVRATEEKQVTERFSKAIELLGSEKLEVRLGGDLRIGKDCKRFSKRLLDNHGGSGFIYPRKSLSQKITTDVQAALTVIGRRDSSKEQDWQRIELPMTNLEGANLTNANLSSADLTNAYFSAADLYEADTNEMYEAHYEAYAEGLDEAEFYKVYPGGANLAGADLSGAKLIQKQISKAHTDEKTKLPDYLQSPNLAQQMSTA